MALTARSCVLDLLAAAPRGVLPVRSIVRAAALFDVTGNQVRVAISRLRTSGHVRTRGRGLYSLGAAAHSMGQEIAAWRTVDDMVRPWEGAWIAAVTTGVPRSNRALTRRCARVLKLLGLREFRPGFWVRPDNLVRGLPGVTERLARLGLPADAPVLELAEVSGPRLREMKHLWDAEGLDRRYGDGLARLRRSASRLDSLGVGAAARESFLEGGAAIRDIVRDPLLPEPLVDADLRRAFVEEMVRYDELGKRIWGAFLGPDLEPPVRAPVNGGLEALHG